MAKLVSPRTWWLESVRFSCRNASSPPKEEGGESSRPSLLSVTQVAIAQHAKVDIPLSLLPLARCLADDAKARPLDLEDALDALHAVAVAATTDPPLLRLEPSEVESVLTTVEGAADSTSAPLKEAGTLASIKKRLSAYLDAQRVAHRRYEAMRTCRRSRRQAQKQRRSVNEEGEWK